MSEVRCGFLTYHPPMDQFPSIVRYEGQWTPEALITRGGDKRFSDAELVAEYWAAHGEANAYMTSNPPLLFSRRAALRRFATHPHFDEDQST